MADATRGILTPDQLRAGVEAGEIDTVLLTFTDLYGRQLGKRVDAGFFLEQSGHPGTHACNYLLTVDMNMDPAPGYRFANWEKGYGDFHLAADLTTLRTAAWLEKTALVICDVVDPETHQLVAQAPRSVLKRQLARAAELGFQPMIGSELEYYIFRDSYRDAAARGYSGLEPAGWYIEDYHVLQGTREETLHAAVRRCLRQSGIPVESSKGEWGRGQHELNLRFADALAMADRHVLFKQCLKETADRLGMSVTFMAKFDAAQAGSSCHVHCSLWRDGANAFAGQTALGKVQASDVFRWFLAGWIAHVPEFMVFYAPTVNSYKRFRAGSWAPTRLAWSYDNRTAGFRIVGHGPSLRIECRIPGADCNPYLCFAAALASGLDGIARRLEPPPAFSGDAYQAHDLPAVPSTLREAVARFESSAFVREALGDEVVEHYAHFFRLEQEAFDAAVTDWERKRYFEQI
ncbi:MAG: glutamine synthetase family protein [Bryobacteraceae bacterium]|nr:glutamine synthetase family protein [Bryobacteraceae bacterium]